MSFVRVRSKKGPDAEYEVPEALVSKHPERYVVVSDDIPVDTAPIPVQKPPKRRKP